MVLLPDQPQRIALMSPRSTNRELSLLEVQLPRAGRGFDEGRHPLLERAVPLDLLQQHRRVLHGARPGLRRQLAAEVEAPVRWDDARRKSGSDPVRHKRRIPLRRRRKPAGAMT